MTCPRCGSHSILRNHTTVACLPCGHILLEPDREAWDVASFPRGGGKTSVPAWTESERLAWAELPPPK